MAKDAAIGVRVDSELKERAGKVFDAMGLPMSLGIELFLKQVAEKGKLPFSLDAEDGQNPEKEQRERDFWRSFVVWYFDAWPRFDSKKAEEKAVTELGFDPHRAPGTAIQHLIDCDGSVSEEERQAASRDLYELRSLNSDAKELIYWALSMDKVFVPSLATEYGLDADEWRLSHLQVKAKGRYLFHADEEDEALCTHMEDLDTSELMDFFDEFMDGDFDDTTVKVLTAAAETATDFEQIFAILEAVSLYDAFEEYVEGELAYRRKEQASGIPAGDYPVGCA